MYGKLTVGAVIPAHNEEGNIGDVVEALLDLHTADGQPVIDDLVVCDNGSTDATAERARRAGARVTAERNLGYGSACLAAIADLRTVDVILFVDGDRSFDIGQSLRLLAAIDEGADLVIGSRTLGHRERGGAVCAAADRQSGGKPHDPVAVGMSGHRPGALPRYPCRCVAAPENARYRLRLDR